jgi:tetratricopeptide (TPR) repeat protein
LNHQLIPELNFFLFVWYFAIGGIILVDYYTGQLSDVFRSDKQYAFLVGAGVSMDPPSNVPSAREMGRALLEYCAVKEEVENLLALKNLRFEMIVEQVNIIFDNKLKVLDYFDSVVNPNLIHLFLANIIVAGHNVITTNFDYCIEHALLTTVGDNKKDTITPIITKEDYNTHNNPQKYSKNRYILVKIHGSKKNILTGADTSGSLITTMSALGKEREKGETFAIEPFKKPTVLNLTQNRNLVVMGYSGSDDFDIGPVLREMPNLKSIIWIEHVSGNLDTKGVTRSDILLSEIEKKVKFPVILLRANTIELVKTILWKCLLPNIPVPIVEPLAISITPAFREYNQPLFKDNSDLGKHQLTSRLFYDLSQYDAVVRVSHMGLDLANKAQDLRVKSYFLSITGLIYQTGGKYDDALKNYTEAVRIAEQRGDLMDKGLFLSNIGNIYYLKSDYDAALKYYFEALKIADQTGDMNGKIRRLNNIGILYRDRGDFNAALKYYTESMRIAEQLGDLSAKAVDLSNIGGIYKTRGEYDAALNNFTEALRIAEQIGNMQNRAGILSNIASINTIKGDYDSALKNNTEALRIEEQLGNQLGKAIRLNNIGLIYYTKGEYDVALKNYTEALEVAEELGNFQNKAAYLNNIGQVYYSKKLYDTALKNFGEALRIEEQLGLLQNKSSYLTNMGSIYHAKGEYDVALKKFTEALEISKKLGAQPVVAGIYLWIAVIYAKKGKRKDALAYAEESLALYRKLKLSKGAKQAEDYIKTL